MCGYAAVCRFVKPPGISKKPYRLNSARAGAKTPRGESIKPVKLGELATGDRGRLRRKPMFPTREELRACSWSFLNEELYFSMTEVKRTTKRRVPGRNREHSEVEERCSDGTLLYFERK